MTRRATILPAKAEKIDWQGSLKRLAVGEKFLLHGITQQQCGARCSSNSKDGRRYVSKRHPVEGVAISRVA